MLKRLATAVTLGLVLSACAGGPPPEPPAPPPLDPTGTYDFSVNAQGMEILGVITIRGSAEAGYTGTVDTDMGGAVLADIAVNGETMTFTIPEAGVSAEVVFNGQEFTGSMRGAMGDSTVSGKKRSGS